MKSIIYNLFLICAGSIVGDVLAEVTAGTKYLGWLSAGMVLGTTSPVTVNLGILSVTFGITLDFTAASVIFVLAFLLIGLAIARKN